MGVPPAYGLFARNVRGLTLQNVRLTLAAADLRPAIVLDHVVDASVNGCSVQGNPDTESALRFIGTSDTLLTAARLLTPGAIFLQVEGADNANIIVDGGDISKAGKALAFTNGADQNAVKLRS